MSTYFFSFSSSSKPFISSGNNSLSALSVFKELSCFFFFLFFSSCSCRGRVQVQVEAIICRINSGRIEYLLLKRLPERNGFWQPVTGGVEEGESRDEALHREIMEETGIEI